MMKKVIGIVLFLGSFFPVEAAFVKHATFSFVGIRLLATQQPASARMVRKKELRYWQNIFQDPKKDFSVIALDLFDKKEGYLLSSKKKSLEVSNEELRALIEKARPELSLLAEALDNQRLYLDTLYALISKKMLKNVTINPNNKGKQ